jgi:hypothetical protein
VLEDVGGDVVDEEANRVSVALEAPEGVRLAVEILTPVIGVAIGLRRRNAAEADEALLPLVVKVSE